MPVKSKPDPDPGLQREIEEEDDAVAASQKGAGRKGRPRKKIDWNQVEYLASMGASAEEIGGVIGISTDSLRRGKRGRIFAAILQRGVMKANVSIRRVLFGTLRGRLVDPSTGKVEVIPIEERISMAKYLANRKTYLNLEEAASEVKASLGDGVSVVRVVFDGKPDDDDPNI